MVRHGIKRPRDASGFLLDSGADIHVVNHISILDQVEPTIPSRSITTANGAPIRVTAFGHMGLIKNVYVCPDVQENLLSVKCLQQQGYSVHFPSQGQDNSLGAIIKDREGETKATADKDMFIEDMSAFATPTQLRRIGIKGT